MPLTNGVLERAREAIEKMKVDGIEEASIPRTPLMVVKNVKEEDCPIQRIDEYVIVQRGI